MHYNYSAKNAGNRSVLFRKSTSDFQQLRCCCGKPHIRAEICCINRVGTGQYAAGCLLRRAKREEKKDTLTFEDIGVNKKTREVTSEGHLCELTLKEFELLVYLMENQSRVVTRDELLNQVWGYEYDGETRTLDMHIKTLRQKLHDAGAQIKTVRGVGYRFLKEKEAGK